VGTSVNRSCTSPLRAAWWAEAKRMMGQGGRRGSTLPIPSTSYLHQTGDGGMNNRNTAGFMKASRIETAWLERGARRAHCLFLPMPLAHPLSNLTYHLPYLPPPPSIPILLTAGVLARHYIIPPHYTISYSVSLQPIASSLLGAGANLDSWRGRGGRDDILPPGQNNVP